MSDDLILRPRLGLEGLWIDGDDDVRVEVREELTCTLVGTIEASWVHPSEAIPVLRVRAVVENEPRDDLERRVAEAVERARRARRRSIRPCADCGEPTPPEHATDVDGVRVCHGCASAHHGIVF
ncbi:MAG: hypothetical protein ACO3KD_02585 [Gaiellales bacterium]